MSPRLINNEKLRTWKKIPMPSILAQHDITSQRVLFMITDVRTLNPALLKVSLSWKIILFADGGVSNTPNFVDLEIISNSVCSSYYGSIISSGTICASGSGGKSTCNVSL
jgi:hypothetical protein